MGGVDGVGGSFNLVVASSCVDSNLYMSGCGILD